MPTYFGGETLKATTFFDNPNNSGGFADVYTCQTGRYAEVFIGEFDQNSGPGLLRILKTDGSTVSFDLTSASLINIRLDAGQKIQTSGDLTNPSKLNGCIAKEFAKPA